MDVPIQYSATQRVALDEILHGHRSMLITGSAGTGKSATVKEAIRLYSDAHPDSEVVVTASTGVAAVAIQGSTVHSALGMGIADKPVKSVCERVMRDETLRQRWTTMGLLVVDEVSMLEARFIDYMDALARLVRSKTHPTSDAAKRPFGGLRIIFVADFCQLAPIVKGGPVMYAFESEAWKALDPLVVHLTEPFRQKDPAFVALLQRVRMGQLATGDVETFRRCVTDAQPTNDYTVVSTHNKDVDTLNNRRLAEIGTAMRTFDATFSIVPDPSRPETAAGMTKLSKARDDLVKAEPAPARLQVCIGARVLLIYNIDLACGLCNGAAGIVASFSDAGWPVVEYECGETREMTPRVWRKSVKHVGAAMYEQVPLRVGFAITVHRSQGSTIARAHLMLRGIFAEGQAYVALSRARDMKHLRLDHFDASLVRVNPKVVEFYERLDVPNTRDAKRCRTEGPELVPQ